MGTRERSAIAALITVAQSGDGPSCRERDFLVLILDQRLDDGQPGWIAGQAVRTVLFHVPPVQPAILAGAAGIIGVVSLVACLVPSRRASRISPMEVLASQ